MNKLFFSTIIAIFSGVSLAVQQPQLPENIVQAIQNLSVDENYQLVELYRAAATPKELIAFDVGLECRQQEIQGIKAVRNWLLLSVLIAPVATCINTSWDTITQKMMLKVTWKSFMQQLMVSGLVSGCYQYLGYDKQLERIAQLRYSIKVAAVE